MLSVIGWSKQVATLADVASPLLCCCGTALETSYRFSSRLVEVGRLQTPKLQGKYEAGQLFLHQVLGYKGVVLFPWVAKVYDRDDTKSLTYPSGRHGKDVIGKTHTYYQTLIDAKDVPHINAQIESVTLMGNTGNDSSMFSIPGLDYVSHEDVIPYTTSDPQPIHNDLFEKFFIHDKSSEDYGDRVCRVVRPMLDSRGIAPLLAKTKLPWLELSEVHRQTTKDIRVTVTPFYMGTRESHSSQVYWWRYCIRIENLGKEKVQLRERHWRIFSLSGTLETVRGRGIVGKEPMLSPEEPAYQYSSHVSLQAPSGHMWGTFKMEKENGASFECKIPPFSLESKVDE